MQGYDVFGKTDLLVADADTKASGFFTECGFNGDGPPSGKAMLLTSRSSQTSHQNSSSGVGIGPESIQ